MTYKNLNIFLPERLAGIIQKQTEPEETKAFHNSSQRRIIKALVFLIFFFTAGPYAIADIPMAELHTRCIDNGMIELVAEFSFKGNAVADCDFKIDRNVKGENDPVEIYNGTAGLAEQDCGCVLYGDATPIEGVEGQTCIQYDDGFSGASSSCPGDYLCSCTFHCNPVYDSPPSGTFCYQLTSNTGYYPARDSICSTIDWEGGKCMGDYREDWLDGGRNGDPEDPNGIYAETATGCGCGTTNPRPHLIMLLIFLTGTIVPWTLAKLRSY